MLRAQDIALAGRLDGVTAALEPGRITAICGPNGAGKSSLLQVLAGLVEPDSGATVLEDRPLLSHAPIERAKRIGYLPQGGEVAWDVAARSLVELGRLPHRDRRAEPVEAAMQALDLLPFARRPVSTLSGGEKARVLLARVLAGEPEWILADEPLAALDLGHQLALLGHLKRAARAGSGVALVVHDLALAMNHADRVLVLDRGQLVADGAPQHALSSDTIRRVWGVTAQWLGEAGARALATG